MVLIKGGKFIFVEKRTKIVSVCFGTNMYKINAQFSHNMHFAWIGWNLPCWAFFTVGMSGIWAETDFRFCVSGFQALFQHCTLMVWVKYFLKYTFYCCWFFNILFFIERKIEAEREKREEGKRKGVSYPLVHLLIGHKET